MSKEEILQSAKEQGLMHVKKINLKNGQQLEDRWARVVWAHFLLVEPKRPGDLPTAYNMDEIRSLWQIEPISVDEYLEAMKRKGLCTEPPKDSEETK